MNNLKIHIILTKAEWCIHCKHFTPIFNKTIDLKEEDNFFKNVTFKEYILEKEDPTASSDLNKLNYDFPNLVDKIEGYPTIFIIINKDEKQIIDNINQTSIDNNNNSEDDQLTIAALEFLNNIKNKIKTMISDKKDLYLPQQGGFTNTNEIIYRKKYIKYKSKYLELQSKFN